MAKLFRQLRKNRLFRLTAAGLKFFTLFLFGVCLVSFISALTLQFSISDTRIETLMRWGLSLLLATMALLFAVITAVATYEAAKMERQRRKQRKIDAHTEAFKAAKMQKEASGEVATHYPGYLGSQDTFEVGHVEGVGYIYQQTFVDTYTRVAFVKLYDCKTALVAADLLNDRVIPFLDGHGLKLRKVLTDQEAQYSGNAEAHQYQKFLSILEVSHVQTKGSSSQTNGICEEFHRTIQEEFYDLMIAEKRYPSLKNLQQDVDHWLNYYNWERPHSGRYCYGNTPMQTLTNSLHLAKPETLQETHAKLADIHLASNATRRKPPAKSGKSAKSKSTQSAV